MPKLQVGIDGIKAQVLQVVGAQLIEQADPSPFLAKIDQHSAAGLTNPAQRLLQLGSTVAT